MSRRRRRPGSKKRRSQRRRAIYVLPNLFTTASLFAGFFAIVCTLEGDFVAASVAVLASLVLDSLDGKVARATKTTSRFGVEYDSLADLVAFGVAPAVLVYRWGLEPFGRLGLLAAFLFVACGALRLARFNVQVEQVGTKHFVGLPIPAAAASLATTILMADQLGHPGPVTFWPMVAVVFFLSFLMVSTIHYPSFKQMGLSRLKSFNWLVAFLLFFILVAIQPQIMGFALIAAFVTAGPFVAKIMAKKRAEAEQGQEEMEHLTSA